MREDGNMILIIAEKPSLARNIVNAIGTMKRSNGFYYNDEYLVSWAFGHLFTLADIEDYQDDPSDKRWKMDNLPCFPNSFKFNLKKDDNKEIDKGVLKQFNILSELCNREDVTEIVNAGDADREGEVIVRLIIENALKRGCERAILGRRKENIPADSRAYSPCPTGNSNRQGLRKAGGVSWRLT